MFKKFKMVLNGLNIERVINIESTLLQVIRNEFGLTGTKKGCGKGDCGACTVIVDGKAINSCIYPAMKAMDKRVETIEGIEKNGVLHPLQKAFIDHGAFQCGFCTPGMIMSAKAFLDCHTDPTRDQIEESISGNLCRCTGYQKIIEAIEGANTQKSIIHKERDKEW